LGSAAFMALFGAGTLPALIAVRMGGALVRGSWRTHVRRASPLVVATMGVILLVRGAQLGIPYLSPDVADAPAHVTACH
jgi:sulfite exporter TauE/SafE